MRRLIFDERGIEFFGEANKRWFDLKRMKSDNGQSMYDYMFNTYLPTKNGVNAKYILTGNLYKQPYLNLLPIPYNEMIRNSAIGNQNNGW
jgi:hypothetical protein